MSEVELNDLFIEKLNVELKKVNLNRLDKSCNSNNKEYAKSLLKLFHNKFIEIYGEFDLGYSEDVLMVPAVLRGRETGKISLGLVALDMESGGEHCGTIFLTPKGVIDDYELDDEEGKYIHENFIPYDYWYTVYLERDHHVDFDNVPEDIYEILDFND